MTVYVGGIRERLIHDSLFYRVKSGLTSLGWFADSPVGYTNAVTMIPEQVDWDTEIPLNSITVSLGGTTDEEWEIGTFGMKNCLEFYIDVYGENEALGLQISGDVRDILRGKFASLGFSQPTLDVLDYTQATPAWIFFCDIEHVTRVRAQNFTHHWQRYMYEIRCEVVDYYTTDQDAFYIESDNDYGPGSSNQSGEFGTGNFGGTSGSMGGG